MPHTDDTTAVAAQVACDIKTVSVNTTAAAGATIGAALDALDELSGSVAVGKVVTITGTLTVCIKDA